MADSCESKRFDWGHGRPELAMQELGYRPNAIARSLASPRTRILALHLPEFAVSAPGETVFEIVRGAYK